MNGGSEGCDLAKLWSGWVPLHGLPPQPQARPSHTTLMGALDAYLDAGAVGWGHNSSASHPPPAPSTVPIIPPLFLRSTWATRSSFIRWRNAGAWWPLQRPTSGEEVRRDHGWPPLTNLPFHSLCRYSFRFGRSDIALAAFREARSVGVVPGRRLVEGMMRGTGTQPLVGLELLQEACTAAPELRALAPRLLALLLGALREARRSKVVAGWARRRCQTLTVTTPTESVSLTRQPEAAVPVLEVVLAAGTAGNGVGDGGGDADGAAGTSGSAPKPHATEELAILTQLRHHVLHDENVVCALLMGCACSGMIAGGGKKGVAEAKRRAVDLMSRGMLPRLTALLTLLVSEGGF